MKSLLKETLLMPVLLASTFAFGFLYVVGDNLARGWAFCGVISLTTVVPIIYGLIVGFVVKLAISRKSLRVVTGLGCGIVAAYANPFWTVHDEFGIWLFGLNGLISAMRMVADIHEVSVLFIAFTGVGLSVAYWIESLVILVATIGYASNGTAEETATAKDDSSSHKKNLGAAVGICVLSACLAGCSKTSEKPVNGKGVDRSAIVAWASSQKWEDYIPGWTVEEKCISGSTIAIGIGVSDVPEDKILIEPNQKRTIALALRAIRKKVNVTSLDDLMVIVNDDFELPNGMKRRVVVVACSR